jgi:hypothetical protein
MAARVARFAAALLVAGASLAAPRAGKDAKRADPYAVVAGTVFRDSGFSLAGAEVELSPAPESGSSRKLKKQKQITDARGEFAFRIPAVPAEYRVSVKAPGYQGEEKPVSINGEERIDVFFRLAPASK